MKIRHGFISNSSATSFVIRIADVSDKQEYFLMHHQLTEGDTKWYVRKNYGFLFGHTTAHSYDMVTYLKKIGVPEEHIIWAT